MTSLTYYVALPFIRTDDGELVAGEGQERQTPTAAVSAARSMARPISARWPSRARATRPSGDFEDAVVIETFGEVPRLGLYAERGSTTQGL